MLQEVRLCLVELSISTYHPTPPLTRTRTNLTYTPPSPPSQGSIDQLILAVSGPAGEPLESYAFQV